MRQCHRTGFLLPGLWDCVCGPQVLGVVVKLEFIRISSWENSDSVPTEPTRLPTSARTVTITVVDDIEYCHLTESSIIPIARNYLNVSSDQLHCFQNNLVSLLIVILLWSVTCPLAGSNLKYF